MISVGIIIGIIEDKIANDLTSNKTPKEHLEDIKKAIKDYKNNTKYIVCINLKDNIDIYKAEYVNDIDNVREYEIKNNFLILTKDDGSIMSFNVDEIREFDVFPDLSEVNKEND